MKQKIYHIDAFTDRLFSGNYAAVLFLENWLADEIMQAIATENNLSETAFVVRKKDGEHAIRWFSPVTEIDFCGHATLAAAFVFFLENPSQATVQFYANAVGELTIRKGESGIIEMSFPNYAPEPVSDIPEELIAGLSIAPVDILANRQAYFAIYTKEEDIYKITSNSELLKKLAPYDVVVTATSDTYDFISRYFWPASGGEEDPVTGSIHAGLAPYWAEKLGKDSLHAFQASKRGGELFCRVCGDKVIVAGKAVKYLEGHIELKS